MLELETHSSPPGSTMNAVAAPPLTFVLSMFSLPVIRATVPEAPVTTESFEPHRAAVDGQNVTTAVDLDILEKNRAAGDDGERAAS